MNINSKSIRILCFGDSNTRGYIPGSMGRKRYPSDTRWTGILQTELGDKYEVIEEGLDARTTAYNDPRPEFPLRNGAEILKIILDSQKPLDWVVLMLGTTGTKEMLKLNSKQIAKGLETNIKLIKDFDFGIETKIPDILIVSPPVVDERAKFASGLFKGGTRKGNELRILYEELSNLHGCYFLDAHEILKVDEVEGVHLSAESHSKLGKKIAEVIKSIKVTI
jgi:lysophospholipase L1-like esterase